MLTLYTQFLIKEKVTIWMKLLKEQRQHFTLQKTKI